MSVPLWDEGERAPTHVVFWVGKKGWKCVDVTYSVDEARESGARRRPALGAGRAVIYSLGFPLAPAPAAA